MKFWFILSSCFRNEKGNFCPNSTVDTMMIPTRLQEVKWCCCKGYKRNSAWGLRTMPLSFARNLSPPPTSVHIRIELKLQIYEVYTHGLYNQKQLHRIQWIGPPKNWRSADKPMLKARLKSGAWASYWRPDWVSQRYLPSTQKKGFKEEEKVRVEKEMTDTHTHTVPGLNST